MNLGSLLDVPAALIPGAPCLRDDQTLTYAETLAAADAVAGHLSRAGVHPGDRVAFMQEPGTFHVAGLFGALRAGAVVAPLNYRMRAGELATALRTARPAVLITDARYRPAVKSVIAVGDASACTLLDGSAVLAAAIARLGPGQGAVSSPVEREAGDCAILLLTSGTTGTPKPVRLNHGALFADVTARMVPPAIPEAAANLLCVPTYHVAGIGQILSSVYAGRELYVMPGFDASQWLRTVAAEHIRFAFVVPTMLRRILDEPDFGEYDLSSLEVLSYGAAPASPELIAEAIERFPKTCGLSNAYGQTETRGTMTILTPADHVAARTTPHGSAARRRLASVGQPIPGVTVDILSPDSDTPLPDGETGEVAVTRDGVPDRMRTGDLGYLQDGYLFLAGRASDRIIRGGENIDPVEVEQILESWPAVAESAVVGRTDREWGETVTAFVVPRPGHSLNEDELLSFARSKLASFKCPDRVIVRGELPRNSLGKVLRTQLRVALEDDSNERA